MRCTYESKYSNIHVKIINICLAFRKPFSNDDCIFWGSHQPSSILDPSSSRRQFRGGGQLQQLVGNIVPDVPYWSVSRWCLLGSISNSNCLFHHKPCCEIIDASSITSLHMHLVHVKSLSVLQKLILALVTKNLHKFEWPWVSWTHKLWFMKQNLTCNLWTWNAALFL